MESYLLYRYQQERGESTLCNFGRFHPRYRKSTNRKENLRGGKLEAGQKDNPTGSLSHLPLSATGTPGQPGWMGLLWSGYEMFAPEKTITAPAGTGPYLLGDAGSQEICYIGQSGNCVKRLLYHANKSWDGKELQFSFHGVEKTVLPHQFKEQKMISLGIISSSTVKRRSSGSGTVCSEFFFHWNFIL
ncbi:MAG: hypothetical protein Q7V05_14470 [Methanoregula sp.]|nr:hypothetical protein [Methanoregula sp.]